MPNVLISRIKVLISITNTRISIPTCNVIIRLNSESHAFDIFTRLSLPISHVCLIPVEYEVQEFQGRNAAETVAGDEISICVWEDRDDKLTLHFEMRNTKNNSSVAYISIKFYPLINSPL